MIEQVEQHLYGFESEILDRLVDGGERRFGERRLRNVVEPDDRHVVGNLQAEFVGGTEDLDGGQVVGGEDRRRAVVQSSAEPWPAPARFPR